MSVRSSRLRPSTTARAAPSNSEALPDADVELRCRFVCVVIDSDRDVESGDDGEGDGHAEEEEHGGVAVEEGYVEWVTGLFTPVPYMHPEIKAFATDQERNSVSAFAVVHGTQTGDGGPVPPTGKKMTADYVYHMVFDGGCIKQMTKIWNDTISLQQLGWA